MAPERNVQFSAPTWLRNLGFSSWLLVGFVLTIGTGLGNARFTNRSGNGGKENGGKENKE